MRAKILLLGLAVVAAASPVSGHAFELGAGQVSIELRPQFVARQSEVTLGDIAILHTTDLQTIQRLATLSLGRSPAVGNEAVVRRDVVSRWVRTQLGIPSGNVLWAGAEETHVSTVAQTLASDRVEQAARAALREWMATRATRYVIDAQPLPADIKLPAGNVELKARPLPANAEPTPRMAVWMDIQVDGRFIRTVPVNFAVDAFRDAWVAPAAVAGGVSLTPGMVEKREVKVTGYASSRFPEQGPQPGTAAGLRTTRAIKEGEPVTMANSAPLPAIARGAWVALHLTSGVVALESRAQALQDGEVGQIVKVRSSSAASPVEARVVSPGRVEAIL
ncbi:flagellar basal body P-ring formation chaperone FlgA [Ramlibacter sp. WS9]|uniref:flagellar basal body P-ring formation chaperone FlgA n=1 Tax=Ramlibacter sp. WS9 TaxID=1882741 RepID=UPI0013052772|nr:flagellar basal body P-ring formation chaperone FlgA [Ramlibacter sp. WS9]